MTRKGHDRVLRADRVRVSFQGRRGCQPRTPHMEVHMSCQCPAQAGGIIALPTWGPNAPTLLLALGTLLTVHCFTPKTAPINFPWSFPPEHNYAGLRF